jgi:hypothetical protein
VLPLLPQSAASINRRTSRIPISATFNHAGSSVGRRVDGREITFDNSAVLASFGYAASEKWRNRPMNPVERAVRSFDGWQQQYPVIAVVTKFGDDPPAGVGNY